MRSSVIVSVLVAGLFGFAASAESVTYVGCLSTADLSGTSYASRCAPDAGGGYTPDGLLTGNELWADDLLISWVVSSNADGSYTYEYRFTDLEDDPTSEVKPNGDIQIKPPQPKDLSHLIIELSIGLLGSDIIATNCASKAVQTFGSQGNSNPGIPGDLYGVSCGGYADPKAKIDQTFTFVVNRIPVWGDVYMVDGKNGDIGNFAYNAGFLLADPLNPAANGSILDHILRPDTISRCADCPEGDVPVPEPASLILLGTGLVGIAAAARKRLRK